MNKRRGYHFLVKLRALRLWALLVAAVACGSVSVYTLRHNNLEMIRLRTAVFAADEANGDIEGALRALREHVHSHMNTSLSSGASTIKPPIQLKNHYERLVQAEKQRVSLANAAIYTEAQRQCEEQFPDSFSGGPRVPCVQAYVEANTVTESPIPDVLYKFDFVSPRWSLDVAGVSLVLSVLFLSLFLLGYGLRRWLQRSVG